MPRTICKKIKKKKNLQHARAVVQGERFGTCFGPRALALFQRPFFKKKNEKKPCMNALARASVKGSLGSF